MEKDILSFIDSEIKNNKVILFAKGSKDLPMCGFSSKVISILSSLNVNFKVVDVLESDELRSGIKEYTNWPTIPQLYIDGKFIGGCDIVASMYDDGSLQNKLQI